ncbi:MAG: GtrA family protein [Acidobacteria bacterium]|nr:GtrA family protein [Acidobacteriota bacterium]
MRIPAGEKLRFLIAGAFNTLFGMADTFACTWLFLYLRPGQPKLMTSAATVVSTVLNITVSFFSYKFFVFRTRGNAIPEYLRSLLVYLPNIAISVLLVVPLTGFFLHLQSTHAYAPYVAQACIVVGSIIFSFLGHKHFTFRKREPPPAIGVAEP